MQAQKISDLEAALMETKKALDATKEMAAAKPMMVATVQFPSGKVGLTAAAMEALDKAAAKIQSHADASVLVKGHADGSPVLRGKIPQQLGSFPSACGFSCAISQEQRRNEYNSISWTWAYGTYCSS